MINIARRQGESVEIGEDVRVVVLGVKGNRVRMGILAPDETHIERIGRDGTPQKGRDVVAQPVAHKDA